MNSLNYRNPEQTHRGEERHGSRGSASTDCRHLRSELIVREVALRRRQVRVQRPLVRSSISRSSTRVHVRFQVGRVSAGDRECRWLAAVVAFDKRLKSLVLKIRVKMIIY